MTAKFSQWALHGAGQSKQLPFPHVHFVGKITEMVKSEQLCPTKVWYCHQFFWPQRLLYHPETVSPPRTRKATRNKAAKNSSKQKNLKSKLLSNIDVAKIVVEN